jgi:hypothetical protein
MPPARPIRIARCRRDASQVAALRRFDRFHPRRIGALEYGLTGSAFALAEAKRFSWIRRGDFARPPAFD